MRRGSRCWPRVEVTGEDDDTIRLWNNPATLMMLHTNSVFSVAFNPHGHTLATGGDDGTVRLWASPSAPRSRIVTSVTDRHISHGCPTCQESHLRNYKSSKIDAWLRRRVILPWCQVSGSSSVVLWMPRLLGLSQRV